MLYSLLVKVTSKIKMIKTLVTGQILTAESKPYDIDGNVGVSHKVRINVNGEIYPLKATEDLVKIASRFIEHTIDVEIGISSYKENLKIELVSIPE